MSILAEQSRHPLPAVLRELRWGRPADAQRFLLRLAEMLEQRGPDEVLAELEDPSEQWRRGRPPEGQA